MHKLLLLSMFLSFSAHATLAGYPCDGVPGTWRTNPDSSPGGFVASSAIVEPAVVIGVDATVCEYAKIYGNVVLEDRAKVTGRATVSGNVLIKNTAEVFGDAQLLNIGGGSSMVLEGESLVGGNAILNGTVSVRDSSQIFGNASVLGVVELVGHSRVCGLSTLQGPLILTNNTSYCPQN